MRSIPAVQANVQLIMPTISEPLPKFDSPPVIETALSVQFARLSSFATATAGWFWKSYLAKLGGALDWSKASDAPRLEDRFERFGENEGWGTPGFRMGTVESHRTQIIRADEERMIQVQDSRFVLNWRKGKGIYPSYTTLLEEFWTPYHAFEQFAKDAGLGAVEPNQWEITYVNHILQGDMWDSPRDWAKIFPSVSFPKSTSGVSGETLNADWRYALSAERGRLYASLRHIKIAPSNAKALQLQLTARGPVDLEKGWSIVEGFELGHGSIVTTFAAMTSEEAHKRWQRRI